MRSASYAVSIYVSGMEIARSHKIPVELTDSQGQDLAEMSISQAIPPNAVPHESRAKLKVSIRPTEGYIRARKSCLPHLSSFSFEQDVELTPGFCPDFCTCNDHHSDNPACRAPARANFFFGRTFNLHVVSAGGVTFPDASNRNSVHPVWERDCKLNSFAPAP